MEGPTPEAGSERQRVSALSGTWSGQHGPRQLPKRRQRPPATKIPTHHREHGGRGELKEEGGGSLQAGPDCLTSEEHRGMKQVPADMSSLSDRQLLSARSFQHQSD